MQPSTPAKEYAKFATWTVFLYGGFVFACHMAFSAPNLLELVAACKVASLLQLIIVSEGITKSINPTTDGDVKRFSRYITISAVILIVLLVIKMLHIDHRSTSLRPEFQLVTGYILSASAVLSVMPILAYAALNLWVGFFRTASSNMKLWARCYFVLADCTCVVPLIFVFGLMYFRGDSSAYDSDVFLSGALTIIILASNLLSKAIEEFFDENVVQHFAARIAHSTSA